MLHVVPEMVVDPSAIPSTYNVTTVFATEDVTVPEMDVADSLTGPVMLPHLALLVCAADETVFDDALLPHTVPVHLT